MSLNKSVLITGAGGFIGLHAVKVFLNAGFEVHAMVHKRIPQELIGMDEVK
ncbi:MAG: NAD-dependent epimerase/dehydratase family protein [Candidatus Gastranaerophilaceae bacterium]